ncbi:hypothetical protein Tco_0020482 [Tanacetum coccineum]
MRGPTHRSHGPKKVLVQGSIDHGIPGRFPTYRSGLLFILRKDFFCQDEPSVNNVHGSGSTSGSVMSSSEDSSSGRSTIKSANIWPLIAVLGLY